MKSKLLSLLYNEILKQLKKTSIFLIIILIVLSAILPAILTNYIFKPSEDDYYMKYSQGNIVRLEELINKLNNITSVKDRVMLDFYKTELSVENLFKDKKVPKENWYFNSINSYINYMIKLKLFDFVEQGVAKEDIYEYGDINAAYISKVYSLSSEDFKKEKLSYIKFSEDFKKILLEEDYSLYLNYSIDELTIDLNKLEDEIKLYELELKKDPQNKDLLLYIEGSKESIEGLNNKKSIYQFSIDNKIDPKNGDWKYKNLLKTSNLYFDYNINLESKEIFESYNLGYSYDQHKKNFEEKKIKIKNQIDINWYSLNNDIPQPEFSDDSRNIILKYIEIYFILVILIGILIAGSIVSSEFSKDTIKILLIKPVSRIKVLFSKFLSVLVISFGTLFLSMVVLILSSLIVYGFNSISIPILINNTNGIQEISILLYMIPSFIYSSISLLFILSLSFSLSTLSKNTSIAVSLPISIYFASYLFTIFFVDRINSLGITFIPFISQSLLNTQKNLISYLSRSGALFNQNFGSLQLIIISIVLLIISFIIFHKKDIKN
ncbi:MAG: ABC transporter permease subunit [Oscillospiraceae bacterium]|nr:ABC transporter permease subunit [Oscillospiraceae bacterium]